MENFGDIKAARKTYLKVKKKQKNKKKARIDENKI